MGTAQKPCGYKDGLQEGSCKEFYENGQVKNTIEWKKGKKKVMLFLSRQRKTQCKGRVQERFQGKRMGLL